LGLVDINDLDFSGRGSQNKDSGHGRLI